MYAEKLVDSYYKSEKNQRIVTVHNNIDVFYLSDNESSEDDYIPKNNKIKKSKLDYNIIKYIKNK